MDKELLWSEIHNFDDISDIHDFMSERQLICMQMASDLDIVSVTCMLTHANYRTPEKNSHLAEIIDIHHTDTDINILRRIHFALRTANEMMEDLDEHIQ